MTIRIDAVRRLGVRLAIVCILAAAVTGVTYAASASPLASASAGGRGVPPNGRPLPGQGVASSSPRATIPSGGAAASSSAVAPSGESGQGTAASPQRPPGGDRGPSLARGLPELAGYSVAITTIVLATALGQAALRTRRRRAVSASRA